MTNQPSENPPTVGPARADGPATSPSTPAPGRPGSLPFTPYGGTTAPYRPKGSPTEGRDTKGLTCDRCRASGFATRADLETHQRTAHPAAVPAKGGASTATGDGSDL